MCGGSAGLSLSSGFVPRQPQCKRSSTGVAGVPSGWNNNNYWSSTPSPSGHANVNLNNGNVNDNNDNNNNYVAFEVL